jgi:hypothetical protein
MNPRAGPVSAPARRPSHDTTPVGLIAGIAAALVAVGGGLTW